MHNVLPSMLSIILQLVMTNKPNTLVESNYKLHRASYFGILSGMDCNVILLSLI